MRSVIHHEAIPKALFSAYLLSGRIWPQTRWCTNIFVLAELAKLHNTNDPYQYHDLNILFKSNFSPQQLARARYVMNQDHLKAGITIPYVTNDLLNSQWLKTKIGVYNTFDAFFCRQIPQYYQESNYEKIFAATTKINQQLPRKLSLDERLHIKKAVQIAKETILEHRELSRMFIASFHSECKTQPITRNNSTHQALLKKYQYPFSLPQDSQTLRNWSELKIFSLIQANLTTKLNDLCPWIIYANHLDSKSKPVKITDALPKIPADQELEKLYSHLISPENLAKKTITTPYHWPDLDGIASAYALTQLLIKKGNTRVQSMIWNEPQPEARWVMKKLSITLPQLHLKQDENIILVDVSDPQDIPSFVRLQNVSTIIDHRQYSSLKAFPNARSWITPVGAAATLIAQLYIRAGIIPDSISAKLLYLAIMSNTIKCKARNTTALDKTLADWLKSLTPISEQTVDEMFAAKSVITNIKQQLDNDLSSKLQIINNKTTAVTQLEIVDAEDFLRTNKSEILSALHQLKNERHAESLFLVVIDIKNLQTFFYFPDLHTSHFAQSIISMETNDYYFKSNTVLTRKDVIALLQQKGNDPQDFSKVVCGLFL